jgi:integrase
MTQEYTVEAFLEYVKKTRSKNTLIMYQQGLNKFAKWYGKSINEILQERREDFKSDDLVTKRRFARKIEEFYSELLKQHTPSTASTLTQGIRALFTYYEMPVKIGGEVDKRVMSTKDVVPRIDQYQTMFKVADNLRDRLIISMGLNLAWRIGDFAAIKKTDLPNLDQETPVPFELLTEKEDVLAKSFLSNETVELLKEYLATLSNENPFLFPSNSKGYTDHSTINRMLQDLAKKAGVQIHEGKRIRFHCFRKRFLSECANLRIDVNVAKILVGKDVEPSMLAYLSEVDLKEAFLRVSERLRLTETPMTRKTKEATELEKRVIELEKESSRQKAIINILGAMYPDAVERADKMLKDYYGTRMTKEQLSKMVFGEKLEAIAKEQERKQQEEYKRLIESNNGNGNGNNEK